MAGSKIEDDFDREVWPFYWVSRTNGLYLKELERELKKIRLDIPRWRALMLLGNSRARSVSYLAQESVAKLNTMTRIIQRMHAEGLVEVRQRKTDARVTEAFLTPAGEKARIIAWEHATKVADKAFDGVSEAQMRTAISVLSKLMSNLEA